MVINTNLSPVAHAGTWDSSVAQYQNQFIRQVTATIQRLAHVAPIRVQNPTFNFDTNNIYFVATLLDSPPDTGRLVGCLNACFQY